MFSDNCGVLRLRSAVKGPSPRGGGSTMMGKIAPTSMTTWGVAVPVVRAYTLSA